MSRKPSPLPRAFTLVELLVVIGIIAILVAILLPALSSAKRQANTTRCAAHLRDIGNAVQTYVVENKGFLPLLRHQAEANSRFPAIQPIATIPKVNEYWYGYLLKYFSKVPPVRDANGDVVLSAYVNTPLWGCPGASKVDYDSIPTTTTPASNFNSGYGMGPYLLYRPDTYRGVNGTPPGKPNASHWPMIEMSTSPAKNGRFMKLSEVRKPADKGFIADSRSWFLEIRDPSPFGDPPPQKIGYLVYDPSQIDQFDRYRHGKYPQNEGLEYAKRGGKETFNVLFLDGHVSALTDVRDGYRAFRGKYPG